MVEFFLTVGTGIAGVAVGGAVVVCACLVIMGIIGLYKDLGLERIKFKDFVAFVFVATSVVWALYLIGYVINSV